MDEKVYGYMDWPRIEAIVYGEETAPRDVMGPRITQDGVLIQGFFPDAEEVSVISGKKTYVCEKEDEAGYFAVLLPVRKVPEYRFLIKMGETEKECYDPYAFPCQITEEEEKAFCAGVYYEAYKKLGAHPVEIKGVKGTLFAVWAPNAVSVNIAGDFNGWIGRATIMHRMPMSGIFELFVPGVEAGTHYKYEIKVKGGEVLLKADPYGNSADHDPEGASVVADVSAFQWNDGDWMKERHRFDDRKQPVSIYETSLEEWKSAEELVEFLAEEDFTHVELHPVMEYLDDITGGYSTYAYYAPTSRFGSVVDFQKLVDELHQAGIGVILDWTPAQFPRYASGLEKFDGTPLYERQNPAEAIHPFWGTFLYNYGSPMVKDFLISNACFWAEVYHADGLRMDDVDAMLTEMQQQLDTLHALNEALPDPQLSAAMARMEKAGRSIVETVEASPAKAKQVRRFANYYLPDAVNVLEQYAKLARQGVRGENAASIRAEVERNAASIATAFENQLDALYAAESMDLSADLTVLQNMMKGQGLS